MKICDKIRKNEKIMIMMVKLPSLEDTQKFAETLAEQIEATDMICFYGQAGAGKTTFISYFIHYLMQKHNMPLSEVTSPTFNLVQEYEVGSFEIAHFDLYRLDDPYELEQIGCDDYFEEKLCLIEWAEKAEEILPPKRLNIVFTLEEECRCLTLDPVGGYSLGNEK